MATEKDDSENGDQKQKEIEERRSLILEAVAASNADTLEQRVALILNNYPGARNSDITLQLKYWETFHPDQFTADYITSEDLYQLPRLTSLARARARIQNQLKLFHADAEVRRRRGTLSEEERERSVERSAAYPVYVVYIDESGKTQTNLVVGSMWILHGPETWRVAAKLRKWREESAFNDELHFANVQPGNLSRYKEAVDVVVNNASALSFKVITVRRAGAGPPRDVIPKLIYFLLLRGIEHEHGSGRAPLPRNLQVWKDAEEAGYDSLVIADLTERLKAASSSHFEDQLVIDVVESTHSKANDLIQIADLFTSSINRIVNPPQPPPSRANAKDELARYVTTVLRISLGPDEEQYEDLAVRLTL